MMFYLFLACTVGDPAPSPEGSSSAAAAAAVREIATDAGAIANAARELEDMSAPARSRVAAGADPAAEIARMRVKMAQIDALYTQIHAKLEVVEQQIHVAAVDATGAQSTAEIAE